MIVSTERKKERRNEEKKKEKLRKKESHDIYSQNCIQLGLIVFDIKKLHFTIK